MIHKNNSAQLKHFQTFSKLYLTPIVRTVVQEGKQATRTRSSSMHNWYNYTTTLV